MKRESTSIELALLVGRQNYHQLREKLADMNPVDISDFLDGLPSNEAKIVFRTLPKDLVTEVFSQLEYDTQLALVETINDTELSTLMDSLAVDDAVDMIEEMPAELVKRVLRNASNSTRKLINEYLRYPEDSSGSIMTPEYTDLTASMTVGEAIEHIRTVGSSRETVYMCYVIDDNDILLGIVTVRDLMSSSDNEVVSDIMETSVISVNTKTDKEEAVHTLSRYSFISLPVVDDENRLVGIITVDDAADVIQDEATEDLEKMSGMAPSERPYLKSTVVELARNCIVWLFILMVSGIGSELILAKYDGAIAAIPLLAAFVPLLTDMGGDAGSQVSTLIIRGMSIGEIELKHMPIILGKEIGISFLVSIPLAILNFLRIVILNPSDYLVAIAISATLICTVLASNILGVILPMVAKKVKIDPAIMATPMIATMVDIISMFIYFTIASILLPI